jgi:hypothetical protein
MKTTIDMAEEAGAISYWHLSKLKAFEALVRADEREACAKTRAGKPRELKPVGRGMLLDEQQFCFDKGWREGAASVRAAIRNRGNT